MNGHPYQSSPSPFHQPPAAGSGSAHNGHSPHVGPGIPPPYPYTVHHPSYPPHGYPSYPQYPNPSSMMMYSQPGPSHGDGQQQESSSPPPPSASATGKRKRKYSLPLTRPHAVAYANARSPRPARYIDSTGDTPRTGSSTTPSASAAETKKRTKTQRACDSCRSRKIR